MVRVKKQTIFPNNVVIYVLQLQGGQQKEIFKDEFKSIAGGVNVYGHQNILRITNATIFHEDMVVKSLMAKYGIEKVRGAKYCQLQLSQSDIEHIEGQILAAQDRCYICKSQNHFVNQCPYNKKEVNVDEKTMLGGSMIRTQMKWNSVKLDPAKTLQANYFPISIFNKRQSSYPQLCVRFNYKYRLNNECWKCPNKTNYVKGAESGWMNILGNLKRWMRK